MALANPLTGQPDSENKIKKTVYLTLAKQFGQNTPSHFANGPIFGI